MWSADAVEQERKKLDSKIFKVGIWGIILLYLSSAGLGFVSSEFELPAPAWVAWVVANGIGLLLTIGWLVSMGSDLARTLGSELVVRKHVLNQRLIEERLRELAVECQKASNKVNRLRGKLTRSREESPELQMEVNAAQKDFDSKHAVFFELCTALERQGYEVERLGLGDGRFSFKLYLPKEMPTRQPAA